MENNATRRRVRDWIDPARIYDPRIPAGRGAFAWGLAIYPFIVLFIIMTVVIIVVQSLYPARDNTDTLGIVTYIFMLAWFTAAVCICLRRLRQLGRSRAWVWLAIVPFLNIAFFLYLLFKPGPAA